MTYIRKIALVIMLGLVRFYQNCISPFTPPSCRFTPTCSQYAIESLRKYGPWKGLLLNVYCVVTRGVVVVMIPCHKQRIDLIIKYSIFIYPIPVG